MDLDHKPEQVPVKMPGGAFMWYCPRAGGSVERVL